MLIICRLISRHTKWMQADYCLFPVFPKIPTLQGKDVFFKWKITPIINSSRLTRGISVVVSARTEKPISITYAGKIISRGFAQPAYSLHMFSSIHHYLMYATSAVCSELNSL